VKRRCVADYDSRRVIHSPKIVIVRDRAHLMTGEPACNAEYGPGKTSAVDAKVTCEKCLALRGES